eukprot:TRINITY_DN34209_c0_g1_i1.p2 TRINITY_DN34209_c0_g1~~TRINITY_DN34209_c0_g1_i1.p2  ORF type:complete len:103 (+),score=7.92 TRINITY_DN34209_c0_g1_i1:325-633(+)
MRVRKLKFINLEIQKFASAISPPENETTNEGMIKFKPEQSNEFRIAKRAKPPLHKEGFVPLRIKFVPDEGAKVVKPPFQFYHCEFCFMKFLIQLTTLSCFNA